MAVAGASYLLSLGFMERMISSEPVGFSALKIRFIRPAIAGKTATRLYEVEIIQDISGADLIMRQSAISDSSLP